MPLGPVFDLGSGPHHDSILKAFPHMSTRGLSLEADAKLCGISFLASFLSPELSGFQRPPPCSPGCQAGVVGLTPCRVGAVPASFCATVRTAVASAAKADAPTAPGGRLWGRSLPLGQDQDEENDAGHCPIKTLLSQRRGQTGGLLLAALTLLFWGVGCLELSQEPGEGGAGHSPPVGRSSGLDFSPQSVGKWLYFTLRDSLVVTSGRDGAEPALSQRGWKLLVAFLS